MRARGVKISCWPIEIGRRSGLWDYRVQRLSAVGCWVFPALRRAGRVTNEHGRPLTEWKQTFWYRVTPLDQRRAARTHDLGYPDHCSSVNWKAITSMLSRRHGEMVFPDGTISITYECCSANAYAICIFIADLFLNDKQLLLISKSNNILCQYIFQNTSTKRYLHRYTSSSS